MNGFNLSNISDLYVGSAKASAIYKGSSLIWQAAPDYSTQYLTIESLADNNTISFNNVGSAETKIIYWSSDKTTWNSVSTADSDTTLKTLSNNEKIYIKGSNNNYASSTSAYNCFSSDAEFNISGNIMSLIYGDNFIGQTTLPSSSYIFCSIFRDSKVVNASNLILPAATLTDSCYRAIFYGCTLLTAAPALPASTLAANCYRAMFYNCTSLTTAPQLLATTLINYCYNNMFFGCTSLSYIKCLATNISASYSHTYWVRNVAATGTFVKPTSTSWSSGISGIPSGWTVVDV